MNITIDQARAIIGASLAHGREAAFNALAVAVLDSGGHLVAFEREDGTSNGRYAIAFGKAHGAISFGANSSFLGKLAVDRPHFITGVVDACGPMIPVAGGVIVLDGDGQPMGAVGISGDTSDNDEAAAIAGIQAAGLMPKP